MTERAADDYSHIAARLAEIAKERAAELAREEELGAAHEPENAPGILQDWFPG